MKARRLRARSIQLFLRADRPSDALLQNGHGNAADRRRGLEEDGTRHGDGRLGRKTKRRQGLQPLCFLAQR
jgi:hypothetical protein